MVKDTVEFLKRKFGSTEKDVFVPWSRVEEWGEETGWVGPNTKKFLLNEKFQELLDYDADSRGVYIPRRLSEESRKYMAKQFADELWDGFKKIEAEARGFPDVESMKKSDEEAFEEENRFAHCVIYPADQRMIMGEFETCAEERYVDDRFKDCIDQSMLNHGTFDWRAYDRTGVIEYVSKRSYWDVINDPDKYARYFMTGNHDVNRECVQALVSANGWKLTKEGWKK